MLKLKLQHFGHLMQRADSLEKILMLGKNEGRSRSETEDEMVGWYHHLLDMSLNKVRDIVKDREALHATVHGVTKSRTRLSDFTFTFYFHALEKEMATHFSGSFLENPRDGGAWWAAVSGVTQSRTRLK